MIFFSKSYEIIPILVGNLSRQQFEDYASVLAPYLRDSSTLFVISSDFCHWGRRFSYTYRISDGPIYQSIEKLDHQAMNAIESLNFNSFAEYLDDTQNTICGRYPILLLLETLGVLQKSNQFLIECKFTHYTQSSQIKDMTDSSVSYAAAYVSIAPK